MNRREFLSAGVVLLAAPAIVRAESLMSVRTILWAPPTDIIADTKLAEDLAFLENMQMQMAQSLFYMAGRSIGKTELRTCLIEYHFLIKRGMICREPQ